MRTAFYHSARRAEMRVDLNRRGMVVIGRLALEAFDDARPEDQAVRGAAVLEVAKLFTLAHALAGQRLDHARRHFRHPDEHVRDFTDARIIAVDDDHRARRDGRDIALRIVETARVFTLGIRRTKGICLRCAGNSVN
jgi:hypothetical protein